MSEGYDPDSQAGCREFESLRPLHYFISKGQVTPAPLFVKCLGFDTYQPSLMRLGRQRSQKPKPTENYIHLEGR